MATEAPPTDAALETADYLLSRLTSWFGNRPDHFSAFIDGNVRAEGWLPAEAYHALTLPVSRGTVKVSMVRGKSQGSAKFDPDLEIDINREAHQLAVVPVLTSAEAPLADQIDDGLAETFEWLGKLKARSIVYLLAFPNSINDDDWKAGVAKAAEKYQAKPLGEMEFVIPRPPRSMARGAAAIFLHESRIPEKSAESGS